MDMCPNCVTPWKCNGPHLPESDYDTEAGPTTQQVADSRFLEHESRCPVTVTSRCVLQVGHEERDCVAELDVELLKESIVKAAAFADGLVNLADLAATEYARLRSG
jgi:hypothetical protein